MEVWQLIGECEKICRDSLTVNPNHEQSLHILYRLNLFRRNKTKKNFYSRSSFSKKYKEYLGKLFLLNRTSVYVFEGVTQHLKSTRRYRLAIAFIKHYGKIHQNQCLYLATFNIFWIFRK